MTPTMTLFLLLLYNWTVKNQNVNICVFHGLKATPVEGSFDPQRGHYPQAENLWSRMYLDHVFSAG